jgi:hypothetical protein
MGLIVDINVDPIEGFRAGYVYAGSFVAALGFLTAILINPEDDLMRFRRFMETD